MAYAAVTCLYHRINHLLYSSRTSVASSTKKILKSTQRAAKKLQRTLGKYDEVKNSSEGVMSVDARIRDEARRLEDAIESEASAQFLSQSESHGTGRLYLNLHHLRHDVDCFVQTVKKMGEEYLEELYKHEEAVVAVSSTNDSDGNDCDMIGLSDLFLQIRDFLARDFLTHRLHSLEITGMAGIGKTALAKKLFRDSLVEQHFDCRAFVKVGQKYEFEEILRAIVAQLNVDRDQIVMEGDETISQYFTTSLRGRKFLIVLDDVWDVNFNRYFTGLLPEHCDESAVLITSRIERTFKDMKYCSWCFRMRFLSEEESWELLRRNVFGGEDVYYCPPQLVKAGKKIAENCEGLPLLIITIAQLLLKAPKSPEYWDEVAKMKNSVFEDACNMIYEVLLSSYHYMTQNSKACFLYMGVFPKSYVVRRSRIINLWRAERFADGVGSVLDYIVSNNLVVMREYRFSSFNTAKACNLHVVYRHLCKREGAKIKFLHILNSNGYGSIEGIKDKRRLAIHHNTLLAIKEVLDSIASCVSTLRSVLCTGPYHQYQVPICLELKLLRVLDALTIRFYEFPVEVVKLIQLRYLSLTTNANLSPSICNLWFLQYLIVHQHLRINRCVAESSYVPVEIWELQELVHLQIVGRNLHHPPPGAILPNLTRLLDVGVQSCTKEVLESVPNLEKLRVQIELAPVAPQNLSFFDHISCLAKLKSLRSVVMNPTHLPTPIAPPRLLSIYSSCLQKLSLNGFGYPWKDMSKIAELPCLEVLKLQCYAFRGEKWDAKDMRFLRLQYLLIEDTDLAKWIAADDTFTCLRVLTMKNCYKLQEISQLKTLYQIKLVDCNPRAETWAKKQVELGVRVKYSWQ